MQEIELYENFIEGNLNLEGEKKFMARLTLDDELRTNFRHFLVVTNSIRNFVENERLPEDVSNSVYTALGLSPIALETTNPNIKNPPFYKGKFFTASLSSLLTLLLTLLFFNLNGINKNFQNGSLNNQNRFASFPIQEQPSKNENFSKKSKISNQNQKKNEKQKYIASKDNENFNQDNEIAVKDDKLLLSPSKFQNSNLTILTHSNNKIEYKEILNGLNFPKYDTIFFIRSYDSKFRFEFKNTPSWFSSAPIVQPNRLNNFNNLSISLLYPLYKTFLLGAEFRQETFYVQYDGKNPKGQDLTYYQQPNFSSYGILLRYSPFDIGQRIKIFGQSFIGINSVGIVTREMLGFEFYPFDNVDFVLGSEYNQFFFKHNNQIFSSNKYSINYGLEVKF